MKIIVKITLLLCVFSALAFSQSKPRVAVYITGLNPVLSKALSGAVSSGLMKAKIYNGIERIDQYVSGTAADNQIIDAGKKADVDFVFVINVSGKVSVSILDVDLATELANVSLDGKMNSPLDAGKIAASIVNFIQKEGPKPPPDYTPDATSVSAGPVKSEDRERLYPQFNYNDFSAGQRWATFSLNYLIPGLGSFAIMKDYDGVVPQLILGITGYGFVLYGIADDSPEVCIMGLGLLTSNFVFNIVRSITYHKPMTYNVLNQYDGLKLAVMPAKTGDFKTLVRYDWSF
jgi:hypothetical protein